MKRVFLIQIILSTFLMRYCVTEFVPTVKENQNILVVEGLITDQPEAYAIKVSLSMPVGYKPEVKPVDGCRIEVSDDLGNSYIFRESADTGIYLSDMDSFRGIVGRKYTLHIKALSLPGGYSYESEPIEMRPVPPIDTLFYEKVTITPATPNTGPKEGAQVYLNSFDPKGNCGYYRWDYNETWKFQLPYPADNQVCWITTNSAAIDIKNSSVFAEDRIVRYPLKFISYESDWLSERYSIFVNQYSISQEEFSYWEKLNKVTQNVGGLYDITPSSIQGNIYCVEDPGQTVLGYFSVSAKTSERIYIDETFRGLVNLYKECPADTLPIGEEIPGLNVYKWILYENRFEGWLIITYDYRCVDCTTRGTTIKPDFWEEQDQKNIFRENRLPVDIMH